MTTKTDLSAIMIDHLQLLMEQEKTALARQIHDDLGGHLIATAMDLAELKQRFSNTDPVAVQKIDRATTSLNAAVDMMRRVTEELHPTLLDNVGLFAALRWQIKRMCQRSGIVCTDHFPELELRLRPTTAITLFRVVQEALVIAENQAGASRLDITITVENELFSMRLEVDGAAELPVEGSRSQVAWDLLRHRLEAMNGSVKINPSAGRGLSVIAAVHLETMSTSDTQAVRRLETMAVGGIEKPKQVE